MSVQELIHRWANSDTASEDVSRILKRATESEEASGTVMSQPLTREDVQRGQAERRQRRAQKRYDDNKANPVLSLPAPTRAEDMENRLETARRQERHPEDALTNNKPEDSWVQQILEIIKSDPAYMAAAAAPLAGAAGGALVKTKGKGGKPKRNVGKGLLVGSGLGALIAGTRAVTKKSAGEIPYVDAVRGAGTRALDYARETPSMATAAALPLVGLGVGGMLRRKPRKGQAKGNRRRLEGAVAGTTVGAGLVALTKVLQATQKKPGIIA